VKVENGKNGRVGGDFDWHFPTRSGPRVEAECKHLEAQYKQTCRRIAGKYTACQLLCGHHSNGAVKC